MSEGTGWQSALSYALLGHRLEAETVSAARDVDAFLLALEQQAPQELTALRASTRSDGRMQAYAVPVEVRGPLGYAQLSALVREVESRLLHGSLRSAVIQDRPLDAAERRLIADAPPHHRG